MCESKSFIGRDQKLVGINSRSICLHFGYSCDLGFAGTKGNTEGRKHSDNYGPFRAFGRRRHSAALQKNQGVWEADLRGGACSAFAYGGLVSQCQRGEGIDPSPECRMYVIAICSSVIAGERKKLRTKTEAQKKTLT